MIQSAKSVLFSNLSSVHGTSVLSILILRMDLVFVKVSSPSLRSRKGVMYVWLPEDTFSLDDSEETHSNGDCASMHTSSAIFENWSFTIAHFDHLSLFEVMGKAFKRRYARSWLLGLIISWKLLEGYKKEMEDGRGLKTFQIQKSRGVLLKA